MCVWPTKHSSDQESPEKLQTVRTRRVVGNIFLHTSLFDFLDVILADHLLPIRHLNRDFMFVDAQGVITDRSIQK